MIYSRIKNFIGRILAFFLFIVLLPLFFFLAILVLLFSGRPIFFKHERLSQEKKFNIYKFRTMINGAMYSKRPAGELITPIGRILRPLYLDELPQLINIIKGDMNLIGPRPVTESEYFITRKYSKFSEKLIQVKPGLTGFESSLDYLNEKDIKRIKIKLKISNDESKSFIKHRLVLDLYYIDNESLLLDLKIIYWTIKSFFQHAKKLIKK